MVAESPHKRAWVKMTQRVTWLGVSVGTIPRAAAINLGSADKDNLTMSFEI